MSESTTDRKDEKALKEARHDACGSLAMSTHSSASVQDELLCDNNGQTRAEKTAEIRSNEATAATDVSDEELAEVAPMPTMPTLQRSTPTNTSNPGAFSVVWGERPVRLARISTGTLYAHSTSDSSLATERQSIHGVATNTALHSIESLVEARPVHEMQPVQTARQSTPAAKKDPTRLLVALAVVLVSCTAVASIVGAWQSGALDSPSVLPEPAAASNTSKLRDASTAREDYVRQSLPSTTLQVIQDPASPQALAFGWLVQDPSLKTYDMHRLRQRFALATFYYSTGGPTWIQNKDWLSYTVHECGWFFAEKFTRYGPPETASSPCQQQGFLESQNSTVTTESKSSSSYKLLWLSGNNLTGPLPDEFYWLTSLESIDLGVNNITGSMNGTNLQKLQHLQQLSVIVNQLTGPIPTELGQLPLQILYLGWNSITGTIPTELGLLSDHLEHLTIHRTEITGSWPATSLSSLSKLSLLGMFSLPYFRGTIPTEWALLTSLSYIYAYDLPGLTGTIPSELGTLSNLAWFHLFDNGLSGPIPSALGRTALRMKELYLQGNGLSSTLPTELGLLSNMYSFKAGGNGLTGSIPTEFGYWTALQEMQLQDNDLVGSLPSELQRLVSLERFHVAGNDLSGSLPGEYSLWPAIEMFNVTGNPRLRGTIPDGLCQLNASLLSFDCSEVLCGCECLCLH